MSTLEVHQAAGEGGGDPTISLVGELDISTADALETLLSDLSAAGGPRRIVIDLSGLRFMDSTGLRLLVTADLRLRDGGRELRLVRGPEPVHRVFRLALLEERLRFVDGSENGNGGSG
jgi:anti-sigma B factor antagonist